jgi:hypothetical protein
LRIILIFKGFDVIRYSSRVYGLVDTQIYCICPSVTADYVGIAVQNPIVIVHARGFPSSGAFGACAFDSATSTTGGKTYM